MIAKTEAIVLRVSPFSTTSHMVTWLTPDYGRLTTVVKGAMRPKSAFLGQYDLCYTCELLFYERERDGVHMARECSPLNTRLPLRRQWRHYTCAAYICDLALHATLPGRDHTEELYELLGATLDRLCAGRSSPEVLVHWFELRLLQLLGYAPHVERCLVCRKGLSAERAVFDAAKGGALCLDCLPHPVPEHVVPLGPDTQSLLRQWSGGHALSLLRNTVVSGKQLLALQRLTGTMLTYCLEMRLECRNVAMATLRCERGEL